MEAKVFKTSLNCGGCVSKATSTLNAVAGEGKWNVDTNSPDKLLTIDNCHIDSKKVIEELKKIGYAAEEVK